MKNNIQVVLGYGNTKNEIKKTDKMYTTVFDIEKDKVIFFECHMERPVGFYGQIDVTYMICSEGEQLPVNVQHFEVFPEFDTFTVGIIAVNSAGEHLANGNYTAVIKIGESDEYDFHFQITGKTPLKFSVLKTFAKLMGL